MTQHVQLVMHKKELQDPRYDSVANTAVYNCTAVSVERDGSLSLSLSLSLYTHKTPPSPSDCL